MKNKTLGTIAVLFGVIIIFSDHQSAWIVSAIMIGFGTGLFFWKDRE